MHPDFTKYGGKGESNPNPNRLEKTRELISGIGVAAVYYMVKTFPKKDRPTRTNPVWETPQVEQNTSEKNRPSESLAEARMRLAETLEESFNFKDLKTSEAIMHSPKSVPTDTSPDGFAYRLDATFIGDSGLSRASVYRISQFYREPNSPDTEPIEFVTVNLNRPSAQQGFFKAKSDTSVIVLGLDNEISEVEKIEKLDSLRQMVTVNDALNSFSEA